MSIKKYTSVRLDNEFNSTMFTTCCGLAVCDDQSCCPGCDLEVYEETREQRWNKAYGYREVIYRNNE